MCQSRAVWSTEPEASFVPVQFQATECTWKISFKSSIPSSSSSSSSSSLGLPQWKKKLQNRKLNINEEREPSSCDLDTLGYGGSWMVLLYLFPPSPLFSLSLAPLPLHSLRLRIFNFKLYRVIIRASLTLLDTMGRVVGYNPVILKKKLN